MYRFPQHLLDSYTHRVQPEQRALNILRQCCLLPQVPISLFVILDLLRLPQVPLECILQVCVQMQQATSGNTRKLCVSLIDLYKLYPKARRTIVIIASFCPPAWSVDQLIDKLQELIAFTPSHDTVPTENLRDIANSLVETVLPKRPDKLLSMAIGCQHRQFQKILLNAISERECILSRARAVGKHFLELHLVRVHQVLTFRMAI